MHWNPLPDGSGCWSVTKHADIAAISRDTETFSSHRGGIFVHPDQVLPLDLNRNMLLYMDPPQHTRYRLILQKAFTPHSVAKMEEAIRARVTRTIDAVIERGSCDFVDEIAVPIPLGVLTELMGVPEQDIPKFYDWTERIEASQRSPEPNAGLDVFGRVRPLPLRADRAPDGRVGRGLAGDEVAQRGGRRRAPDRSGNRHVLRTAGVRRATTPPATRRRPACWRCWSIPGELQKLYDDPSRAESAVEEILRWTSVVQWFNRTATRDTELGDRQISEGDRLVMWYASGSRDEDVFDDPDTFDIDRAKPDHMAFGGGGRHFCLGAGLARLELRIVFEEVARRMKDLRIAGEVERLPSNWANGLIHLPVEFTSA